MMLGLPKAPKPRPLELCECPHCASRYVHPTRWQAQPDGAISLRLRCPECQAAMEGTYPAAQVRELDRELSTGRILVRETYERVVRRHMYQELQALRNALARDLIGADDFRPHRTSAR
jgi:NMD protein affecting ribosome stability and mRNA decay